MSTGSSSAVGNGKPAVSEAGPQESSEVQPPATFTQQNFLLSIHEEPVSKEDVLLNLPPNCDAHDGDVLQLTAAVEGNSGPRQDQVVDANSSLHFLYRTVSQETMSRAPALQISISRPLAVAFGFEKGIRVLVSRVDRLRSQATHVEIVFRDQYLARADMWRLIASELSGSCIYRGQKVEFLGTIRAQIKNIFIRARKVQSALFHPSTKPIFRSESARYVIFIQMSKEMWDFDAEGSGDIMFDKVINGFLPELFKRWHELKVKHLVSIVLFTRMIYEGHTVSDASISSLDTKEDDVSNHNLQKQSKDFYRVIVSDVASGEWADILNQLKREFKVFLRDISIRRPNTGDHLPLGEGLSSALADAPSHVIAGHPSAAIRGNILEAINLASSQFSSDYIDRDLVRTGVSIVVLSPGAGVFEVDYALLLATTENLIDNGVGIDLVCLSKMPLHSVPLFKYRPPHTAPGLTLSAGIESIKEDENTPTSSLIRGQSLGTPLSLPESNNAGLQTFGLQKRVSEESWSYGIPHWVDVSFWNPSSGEVPTKKIVTKQPADKSIFDTPQHKAFIPRVKMYELQMMGVMENAVSSISIPCLSQSFHPTAHLLPNPTTTTTRASPETATVLSVSNSLGSQHQGVHHTPGLSTSSASDRSATAKSVRRQHQWMDDYDDLIFRHPLVAKKRARRYKSVHSRSREQRRYSPSLLSRPTGVRDRSLMREDLGLKQGTRSGKDLFEHRSSQAKSSRQDLTSGKPSVKSAHPKAEKSIRYFSFGPRGFSAKAVASTEVTTKYSEGSLLSRGLKSGLPNKPVARSRTAHTMTQSKPGMHASQDIDIRSNEIMQSSESDSQQSRPIPIRNSTAFRISRDGKSKLQKSYSHDHDTGSQLQDRLAALQDLRDHEGDKPAAESDDAGDIRPPVVALSPSTALAPWLTILNPSNPSKAKVVLSSQLGRWQHVFPRPLKSSQIKWKSLCSPAAVPLTTEEFPSAEQIAEEYEGITYDIDLIEDSEVPERPRSLVNEIIAFRLSRGFQLVVGPRVADSVRDPSLQTLNVFDEHVLREVGTSVFLSRGSMVHRISLIRANKVEVKQLFRHGGEAAEGFELGSIPYRPFIRSMLGQDYEPQDVSITSCRSKFDWKTIDAFVAGHERPQAQDFVASLRPWRARFVLIPVEAPSSTRRRQRLDEDDEEEIRLEGIRKLTQVWQRFRYIPPNERRYQAPSRNRKDTNPLDIMYQTRDPSAIVAAELENVAEGDATGRQVQLLPESDLYQRSNFKVASLAETIQSEKGVRMLDRRWHLRLHYNCFIGFELTSWLLQNFRDVDTRDEAVDLGNELMKSGMFKHVEQRHNFRDGNYFYQIADEYRSPRPESRGWFGRSKASIPSTPMSEEVLKELSITSRSRSSSNSSSKDSDPTTPTDQKKQLSVALSKSLIYDVDHRKRSYRPELINLHYDRLHNPDNCYHIRVEWMNTTPKLIQDAIVSWATSVERFGLRLVEVPLGEASSITSTHPFRAPYLIKLAHQPPARQPPSYFDSTSFAPQPKTEKHFYQKAIMKRCNFVLDFEAASDFPANVDVTYSWGKPDYRFPQYIHRSGMLIAQISDEGDFLVLANRPYNNRNMVSSSHNELYRSDHFSENDRNRGPGFFRSSPHRGSHAPARPSPHESPYSSPSVRATLDVPLSAHTSQGHSPISSVSKHIDPTRPISTTSTTTPEATKRELEAFCSNVEALTLFYEEVLSKASTPGPNTPFMGSKTPGKAPEPAFNESSIPTLALPGSVVNKTAFGGRSGKHVEAKTKVIGSQSPSAGGVSTSRNG